MIEIENELDFLKNSLLYQMSLGSKELYHSNIWAWLIEKDNDFIKVFFPTFNKDDYEKIEVSREVKNRDIIIWLKKRNQNNNLEKLFYVIENKIKSIPTKKQLEEYTEDLFGNKLGKAVLTGLENSFENSTILIKGKNRGIKWEFVSYNEIADKIEELANNSKVIEIRQKILQIQEYCKIIRAIKSVSDYYVKEYSNKLICKKLIEDKNHPLSNPSIRLYDIFIKLKGSRLFNYVNERKEELKALCPSEKGFFLDLGQGYHNKKSTIDISFNRENYGLYSQLGVQIEGAQYRICVRLLHKANKTINKIKCKELYQQFVREGWFDEKYNKTNKMVFNNPTRMSADSYDKYIGDDYVFVYQYYNLTEENSSFDDLFFNIKKDLEKARKIILKLEN